MSDGGDNPPSGDRKAADANQRVIPVIVAAWVIVLLCGLLVCGLA